MSRLDEEKLRQVQAEAEAKRETKDWRDSKEYTQEQNEEFLGFLAEMLSRPEVYYQSISYHSVEC